MILVWIFFSYGSQGLRSGRGAPQQSVDRAKDILCKSNLRQIRQTIMATMAGSPDDVYPRSLGDLGLPEDTLRCPVNKQWYLYDSTNGKVWCTEPRHARY